MDFFGIGPLELLLILFIALLVLGPGKLPEAGRTLGRFVRQLRNFMTEASRNLSVEMTEPEAKPAASDAKKAQDKGHPRSDQP